MTKLDRREKLVIERRGGTIDRRKVHHSADYFLNNPVERRKNVPSFEEVTPWQYIQRCTKGSCRRKLDRRKRCDRRTLTRIKVLNTKFYDQEINQSFDVVSVSRTGIDIQNMGCPYIEGQKIMGFILCSDIKSKGFNFVVQYYRERSDKYYLKLI